MNDQAQRQAYCPRCNRHGIRTEKRGDREVYRLHEHVPGGGVSCPGSHQVVQRRARRTQPLPAPNHEEQS